MTTAVKESLERHALMDEGPTLDRDLNLVFPFGNGRYAFIRPLKKEQFKFFYKPLSVLNAQLRDQGAESSAPFVSGLWFRELCDQYHKDADQFFNEIKRTGEFVYQSMLGQEETGLDIAINEGILTDDEWDEIENFIPFYTALSYLTAKPAVPFYQWRCRTTAMVAGTSSKTCTAYLNSLPTLTPEDSTGATEIHSSTQ